MAFLSFCLYLLLKSFPINAALHHPLTLRSASIPIPIPSACTTANNIVTSCISATPDFNSLSTKDMASCMCYTSSTSWVPDTFDQNILSCADFYSSVDPAQYSSLVVLEDFCHKAGDVMTDTAAPTTTTTTTENGAQKTGTAIQTTAMQNSGRGLRTSGRGGLMWVLLSLVFILIGGYGEVF